MEGVVDKEVLVRDEPDHRSVLLLGLLLSFVDELSFCELRIRAHAVAVGLHIEMCRKRIHGLQTHSVQTHRLLVTLGVILTSGIQDADSPYHRTEGNSSSEVPYCRLFLRHCDMDLLSETHGELVYRVVHYFLEEHVYAVSLIISVTESSDVHSGALADMLHALHGPDVVVCIINYLCHMY